MRWILKPIGNFTAISQNKIQCGMKFPQAMDWFTTGIQTQPTFKSLHSLKLYNGTRPISEIKGARPLAIFGDSVTTDHISPAGSIKEDSPAGKYLLENGVSKVDFNSYGSRRGNDRVMTRGTFANVRIRNLMVPGKEGGYTVHYPSGEVMTILRCSDAL